MADRKKSPIWSVFSVAEDSKFAKCYICKQAIFRGGKMTKSEYDEYQKQSGEHDSNCEPQWAKQLTLTESCDKIHLWDTNDHQAYNIHWWIGEMIAIDCQPLSIIDDQGFQSLV